MLYRCKVDAGVWKGLDGEDIYERLGIAKEGDTILVIKRDEASGYFNVMMSDGTVGWMSEVFILNKMHSEPVRG
jgi:hypothetical protein